MCAFQYRKVRHQWFSSNSIGLSKSPQWLSVERARDKEDGEDDIIEVEARAVLDKDLGGPWDKTELPDGEVLCFRRWSLIRKSLGIYI